MASDPIEDRIRAIVREELAKLSASSPPAEYLTASAAARLAGVSARTIRNWVAEGRLPMHRAGARLRVKRADLVDLLERGGGGAALSPEEQARRDFG